MSEHKTRPPRIGDPLSYKGNLYGRIMNVEKEICWFQRDSDRELSCFIWQFKDGLNVLFNWPGKSGNDAA